MSWTHSICPDCWNDKNPEREPIKFIEPEKETCCFCGEETTDGIYIRNNPADCKYCNHKEDSHAKT